MLTLLRQKNFARLWCGQLISLAGDWILFIALPIYIYELTGSAFATGVMFIIESLPMVLLGSVAGVFVDRWDRRRVMLIADFSRAIILLPLVFLHSSENLWLLYLVAFLESTLSQFFMPAKSALMPRLVSERDLLMANSLDSLSNNLTRLIGPALGGVLLTVFGLTSVVLADSVSYLVSGVMITLITVAPNAETPAAPVSVSHVAREWLAGLRLVRHERVISAIFLIACAIALGEGILSVLLIPFAEKIMGANALEIGYILSAQAIGGITGGLLIGRMGQRFSPAQLIALGGVVDGLMILTIFNFPSVALAFVLIMVAGVPVVGMVVSFNTLLQTRTADAFRGRVFGALNAVYAVLMLVGRICATALGDRAGIVPLLNVDGLLYVAAGILALVLLHGAAAPMTPAPAPAE